MAGKRPDVLAGMTRRQREKQIAADIALLERQPGARRTRQPAKTRRVIASFGHDWSSVQLERQDPIKAIICRRVNLDTPILPGNLVRACEDCDCDIQHSPETSTAPPHYVWLCIPCAARRVRERS